MASSDSTLDPRASNVSYYTTRTSYSSYYSTRTSSSPYDTARATSENVAIETIEESPYMAALRDKKLPLPPDEEVNWSGRGQHVEFKKSEKLPLEVISSSIGKSSVIGQGATAVVDVVLCRRIKLARKSIRCNRGMTPEMVLVEVEHLQRLRHRHVVQLVGSYLQDKTLAILLYPVADFNLEDFFEYVVEEDRDGDVRRSLRQHCGCLIHALEFIHTKTIKHMDIKPKNVLVKQLPSNHKEHRFYIADFGISRSFEEHSQTDGPAGRSLRYCSPEVYNQDLRGRSADVFSMGCVLLEIWTVWAGKSLEIFANLRVNDVNRSYRANLPSVMLWIDSLEHLSDPYDAEPKAFHTGLETLRKMLEADPSKRPLMKRLKGAFPSNACCDKGPEQYQTEIQKLVEASSGGNEAMVGMLLEEGVNVEAKHYGETALHAAARCGHEAIVRLLLDSGADPNARDGNSWTALHWATWAGYEGLVWPLLEHAADWIRNLTTWEGFSSMPLEDANDLGYRRGGAKLLRLSHCLFEELITDVNDEVLRRRSVARGGLDVPSADKPPPAYLPPRAHFNPRRNEARKKLSILPPSRIRALASDVFSELKLRLPAGWVRMDGTAVVEKGANAAAQDDGGWRLFHGVVGNGHEAVVRLLLEKGSDTAAKDSNGWTALHGAAKRGSWAMTLLLLEYGADAEARNTAGETARQLAEKCWNVSVARLLPAS